MITTWYEVRLSATEKRQQNLSELEILKGFPIIEFSFKTFYLEGINNNVDSRVGHDKDVTDICYNFRNKVYKGILFEWQQTGKQFLSNFILMIIMVQYTGGSKSSNFNNSIT